MFSWQQFAEEDPELAAFGLELLERYSMAHLATVRQDGGPRLHPVCPGVIEGHLYVGIKPASPKCRDLIRDGRYVLHTLPGPNDSEFFVRGRAVRLDDPWLRALAAPADGSGVLVNDEDILFELYIEQAFSAIYEMGEHLGQPLYNSIRRSWPPVSIASVS